MNPELIDDPFAALGGLAGAFLVLVGLATLAGPPWAFSASAIAAAGQTVGALAAIAVGAGLAWLALRQYREGP